MANTGTQVQKMGRTTGYTTGRIEGIEGTFKVDYRESGEALFKGVTTITTSKGTFSDGGDSGSLILDRTNRAIALLFAGSSTHTLAIPICKVMDPLKITSIK
jgi:Peptidase family S64